MSEPPRGGATRKTTRNAPVTATPSDGECVARQAEAKARAETLAAAEAQQKEEVEKGLRTLREEEAIEAARAAEEQAAIDLLHIDLPRMHPNMQPASRLGTGLSRAGDVAKYGKSLPLLVMLPPSATAGGAPEASRGGVQR
jgi:hypothetical protein